MSDYTVITAKLSESRITHGVCMHRVGNVSVNSVSTIQTGRRKTAARIASTDDVRSAVTLSKKRQSQLFGRSCVVSSARTSCIDIELYNDLT
jgi:hypothetical protein